MGTYSMRSGKDALMFRIAIAAYNVGFTPNMVTAMGLTLGIASGVLFASQAFAAALTFGVLSVFCDSLDGTLARKFHRESKRGLIFDSAADRITEGAVVLGALAAGIIGPLGLLAIVGSVSLLGLRILSYRKKLNTNYVLFGRFERLVCILLGLLLPFVELHTACFVAAGLFGLVSSGQIAWALRKSKV